MTNKLEDLVAWQEARKLRKLIYYIVKGFPETEKFIAIKHLKECSRNIPGNIAEGFGRFHFQESMQFYRIARGSLHELKSDLYCSHDSSFINQEELFKCLAQAEFVGKLLNGLIKTASIAKNCTDNR